MISKNSNDAIQELSQNSTNSICCGLIAQQIVQLAVRHVKTLIYGSVVGLGFYEVVVQLVVGYAEDFRFLLDLLYSVLYTTTACRANQSTTNRSKPNLWLIQHPTFDV